MQYVKKSRIAVIGPISPQWSEINFIKESLSFLDVEYDLQFFDPLCDYENKNTDEFLIDWKIKLKRLISNHDGFIGFSLGGVILQQCFDIFSNIDKPIILFSVPSFINDSLNIRLSKVIALAQKGLIKESIDKLNQYVFYPNKSPKIELIDQLEKCKARLIFGINYVLKIDSRSILKMTKIKFLHFIGEKSQLVNCNNVTQSVACKLINVPHAGMRLLQSHADYCTSAIMQYLRGE